MSVPNVAGKETVYVDVDDEITTIIDKVRSSKQRIVALVLPKRASVFQSIVNMKLLKRSADDAQKNLVLITSEAGLLPLAATVGLYVAPNLQSKPEIPVVQGAITDDDIIDESDEDSGFTTENAGNRPIGDLAVGSGALAAADGGIETLALDDDDEEEAAAVPVAGAAAVGAAKLKKDKKLKVPNFNRFRALIAIGIVLLLALIVGLYFALSVLPKALITIKTDATSVNSTLDITLDTTTKTLNKATLTVPAQTAQQQKAQSQQVAATGSKNNGEKATGSVILTTQRCAPNIATPDSISPGAGVSTGGNTFITQTTSTFTYSGPSGGGSCVNYVSNSVPIVAQAAGTKYNVSGATFSVAGHSDTSGKGTTSGGTDAIVKVVQQADIDGATQKLATVDTAAIKVALAQQLSQGGLYALPDTFDAGQPTISSTSAVGDQADTVTVTANYTYTMYGTAKINLDTLLNDDIKSQVDTSKETILTNGLDSPQVRVLESTPTAKKINLQTTGTVGPDLHLADIKKQAAGKKVGEIVPLINNLPGVTDVQVKLSPFWVGSVPAKTSKITIVVEKPTPKK